MSARPSIFTSQVCLLPPSFSWSCQNQPYQTSFSSIGMKISIVVHLDPVQSTMNYFSNYGSSCWQFVRRTIFQVWDIRHECRPIPELIQLWQITSGRLQSIEAGIIPITDSSIKPLGVPHNVYSIREVGGLQAGQFLPLHQNCRPGSRPGNRWRQCWTYYASQPTSGYPSLSW